MYLWASLYPQLASDLQLSGARKMAQKLTYSTLHAHTPCGTHT